MALDTTKTLDEIVALYELEPSLKDIYVEGMRDKDVIDSYLQKSKREDISVYIIDNVLIPDSELERHGLSKRSNRAKVVALSYLLKKEKRIKSSILCIIDRDFEDFLPSVSRNQFLALTDFNSLESYALQTITMTKFINVALGHLPINYDFFIPYLCGILKRLFFIRLANEKLDWGMEWLSPLKYLTISRDAITFDEDAFINAYLLKNSMAAKSKEFVSAVNKFNSLQKEDRCLIRGHDLVDLLHFAAKKLRSKRQFGDYDFFSGALLATLEAADFDRFPLFQQIIKL